MVSQEFRLKNKDEARDYFIAKLKQNEMMSKKYKNVCVTLNYIDHLLIVASAATACVSTFTFASLVGIPIRITS